MADVIRILDGARRVESSTRRDDLHPIWHSISEATMAAAESFTLASMAEARRPPGDRGRRDPVPSG